MKNTTTSNRLQEILKQRKLKQADVLRLCEPLCKKYNVKMGRNDLSQYVSGKVQPKQDKLTILGMALNVSEVWLMGYDVPMVRTPQTNKDKLLDLINNYSFSNEETNDIMNFINFIISKRKC